MQPSAVSINKQQYLTNNQNPYILIHMFRVFACPYVLILPYPVLELIPFHGRGLEVVLALVSALFSRRGGGVCRKMLYSTSTAAF